MRKIPRRATWALDDRIYFDENPGAAGSVSRVAAQGGEPAIVIPASDEGRRTFSQMMPDGRTALMSSVAQQRKCRLCGRNVGICGHWSVDLL